MTDNENLPVVHRDHVRPIGPHPITSLIPMMTQRQLSQLTRSIREYGQASEIVLFEGRILDGRAVYEACLSLNIEPRFRQFSVADEGNPALFVINSNLLRKLFPEKSQRAMIAAGLVQSEVGANQYSEGVTVVTASLTVEVSRQSVHRAIKFKKDWPTAATAIFDGRMTIGTAITLTKLPPNVQSAILAQQLSGPKLKKTINDALREWRRANPVALPEGRFNVIVSDPAWPVDDVPYLTDRIAQIETDHRTWLAEKAANDCHLFLWTTSANLPAAIKLIEALGWKYSFLMTWQKSGGHKHPNRPTYNGEYIVVAIQGSPNFIDTRGFRTVFDGPRGKHSEKPDEFYDMIRGATAGPRLELHTRGPHAGFAGHGDEMDRSEQDDFRMRNEEINYPSYSAFLTHFSNNPSGYIARPFPIPADNT